MFDKLKEFCEEHTAGAGCLMVLFVFVLIIGLAFGLLCLEGWFVMLLWNAVICTLWTSAPHLTFWLAVGLVLLCNILFKTVHSCTHKKD